MNNLYREAFAALLKRWLLILVATGIVGGLAVTKELLVPGAYTADTLLLVTGVVEKGGATEVMPPPLNPKAYEQLLTSNAVLGQVLKKLVKDKTWPEGAEPMLEDFRRQVAVEIIVVDETTRPINYSPLIRLTGIGETEEQTVKIVNTWAEVAMEKAQRAVSLKVGAPAMMLAKEKDSYETSLESVWQELKVEKAVWNLDVLKTDLNSRVELQAKLLEQRGQAERNLAIAREKLRMLREDAGKLIESEREKFAAESSSLREEMTRDMAEANVETMKEEMAKQLNLAIDLDAQAQDLTRQVQGIEQRLIVVQEQIAREKPFLELGRAPSEAAYWIVEGEKGKSMFDLQNKVMVSQELNPVYQELKKVENDAFQGISQKKAELDIIKGQLEASNTLLAELRTKYGQHNMSQSRISTDLNVSEKRFMLVGAEESVTLVQLEREAMLEQAGAQAQLTSIERQLDELKTDQDELKKQLAEHSQVQTRLQTKEELAKAIFSDIASAESFIGAAYNLASSKAGADQTVGLNRLSDETYAVIDKGLLGRKGRVIVTTALAFALLCGFVVLREAGLPQLRIWLNTVE